jgi:hypothetical protein
MGDIDTEYLRSLFEQLTYSKIWHKLPI